MKVSLKRDQLGREEMKMRKRNVLTLIIYCCFSACLLFILSPLAQAKSYLYIPNQAEDTVSVIDENTNANVTTISMGDEPYGVAVSPEA
jgi:YVTN family beta-propeller protein